MSKIRAALVQHLLQAPAIVPEARACVENVKFTPPSNGVWLQIDFMPASHAPRTLGTGGTDMNDGIFQVLVCVPVNSGIGDAQRVLDALNARFFIGLDLLYQGTRVTITRVQRSSGFQTDLHYKIPVSIHWRSNIARPTNPV